MFMKQKDLIIEKYTAKGVSLENIEYAISAVKDGNKREHTLESLTADYRGMDYSLANSMLEEMYLLNGGEFKKENRNGYLFGSFSLIIGSTLALYIFYVIYYGGILISPIVTTICAFTFILSGLLLIIKAVQGKYRDDMEPFKD